MRSWTVVRPFLPPVARPQRVRREASSPRTEALFAVPICSTLALDEGSYERFLSHSGVLETALDLLAHVSLDDEESVETVRKQIQANVMAAEVQYIVERMPA